MKEFESKAEKEQAHKVYKEERISCSLAGFSLNPEFIEI